MSDFDIVVIGGTSEGLAAARTARTFDAKVAIVEPGALGAEELQSGRIPIGALIKAAGVYNQCQESMEFGIRSDNVRVTWSALKLRIADVQDDVRALWREQLKAQDIEHLKGTARFEDAHTLSIESKTGRQTVTASKFILATGDVLAEPEIDGLAETGSLTITQLFALPEMPRSLTILGNGAVAVELAFALARLGCKVTVLHSDTTILPEEEYEISAFAEKLLLQEGVVLHAQADIQSARQDGEKKQVAFETNGEVQYAEARHILALPQKRIDLASFNIEAVGVTWNAQAVQTDEYLQAAPNLWVSGVPISAGVHASGTLAARNALASSPQAVHEHSNSRIVSTDPGIATFGLTEAQAREKWNDVQTFEHRFSQLERAIVEGETRGFVKLVTADNGRILGAHIAGQNAAELLTPFLVAMQSGNRFSQLIPLPFTFSESVHCVLAEYVRAVGGKQ